MCRCGARFAATGSAGLRRQQSRTQRDEPIAGKSFGATQHFHLCIRSRFRGDGYGASSFDGKTGRRNPAAKSAQSPGAPGRSRAQGTDFLTGCVVDINGASYLRT